MKHTVLCNELNCSSVNNNNNNNIITLLQYTHLYIYIPYSITVYYSLLPGCPKGFWHSFHGILVIGNVHGRHTRNFTNSASQLLITRGNNETSPLLGHLNETVIGITTLTITRYSLESWIFGKLQCNPILLSQLFKFSHYAIGNAGNAFGQKTVHHGSDDIHFISNRKIDKVCIHQYMIRRSKLCVVLKEESRNGLFDLFGLCLF